VYSSPAARALSAVMRPPRCAQPDTICACSCARVSEWHTRLSRSPWREGFEVVEGDVTDETAVARALEGCEALHGKRACAGTLGDHRDGLAVPVHGEGRVSLAFPRLYSRMTHQSPCWRVRPRGCYACGIQRRCSNSGRDPTDLDRPGTTSSPDPGGTPARARPRSESHPCAARYAHDVGRPGGRSPVARLPRPDCLPRRDR
jgi:hypothetical protein